MLGQRQAAHIHAQQARDDVDRQHQDRDDGQDEQAAIVLLVDHGGDFFLQQLDALLQGRHVAQYHREFLARGADVLDIGRDDPAGRMLEHAHQRRRFGREHALQPDDQTA